MPISSPWPGTNIHWQSTCSRSETLVILSTLPGLRGNVSRRKDDLTRILASAIDLAEKTAGRLEKGYSKYEQDQQTFKSNIQRATYAGLTAGGEFNEETALKATQKGPRLPGTKIQGIHTRARHSETKAR